MGVDHPDGSRGGGVGLTLAWPGAHGYRPHPGRPHPVRDGLGEGGEGRLTDWWDCG